MSSKQETPESGLRSAAQTIAIMKRINPEWSETEIFDCLLRNYLYTMDEHGADAGSLGDLDDIIDTINGRERDDNSVELIFTKYVEGNV